MQNRSLSERDICTKFITPSIFQAGWSQNQFREELKLTEGRVIVRGKLLLEKLKELIARKIWEDLKNAERMRQEKPAHTTVAA